VTGHIGERQRDYSCIVPKVYTNLNLGLTPIIRSTSVLGTPSDKCGAGMFPVVHPVATPLKRLIDSETLISRALRIICI